MRRSDLPANVSTRCVRQTALSFFAGKPRSYRGISSGRPVF
jgi:hypothetical protein